MLEDAHGSGLAYDEKYKRTEYFRYPEWLYRPYTRALIRKVKIRAGSYILDAGCGQGYFTGLFAELGLNPVGIDVSEVGVRSAEEQYGQTGARFQVGDILSPKQEGCYDCVFARGLSLYNFRDFRKSSSVTDTLLRYLKPTGVLIFSYHTNLCPRKKSESWIYHSLSAAREHFSPYEGARVYFSLRGETLLLGRWSFCAPETFLTALISRVTGVGGELIVFVPRSRSVHTLA